MEWRAHPPEGAAGYDAPDPGVEGTEIRMMPEYSLRFPLWDAGGPLEARELLEGVLGLSGSLVDELARWQDEWDEVNSRAVSDDTVPVKPLPHGWSTDHEARGRRLFDRLQREIDPGFDAVFQY